MPGQLHPLPRGQVRKDLAPRFLDLLFDLQAFLLETDVDGMLLRVILEIVQLGLQFEDWLLEVELVFHAAGSLAADGGEATRNSVAPKSREPDLRPALASDEVY